MRTANIRVTKVLNNLRGEKYMRVRTGKQARGKILFEIIVSPNSASERNAYDLCVDFLRRNGYEQRGDVCFDTFWVKEED